MNFNSVERAPTVYMDLLTVYPEYHCPVEEANKFINDTKFTVIGHGVLNNQVTVSVYNKEPRPRRKNGPRIEKTGGKNEIIGRSRCSTNV